METENETVSFYSLIPSLQSTENYPIGSETTVYLSCLFISSYTHSIAEGLRYKAAEYEGTPMIYELVEVSEDHVSLRESHSPRLCYSSMLRSA